MNENINNNFHYNGYKKFKKNLIYKYKNGIHRYNSDLKELDQFVSIKDFLAKELSKGPEEDSGEINYFYQKYSNVYNYFYLLTKYFDYNKILCMPKFILKFKKHNLISSIIWFIDTNSFYITEKLIEEIKYCESKKDLRFTYFTLIITNKEDKKENKNKFNSHANIMIIDMYKKTIERFEPFGQLPENYETRINKLIKSKILELLEINNYEYLSPIDISPILGLQSKYDNFDGICVSFIILYLQSRLMNPDIPQIELLNYYLKKNKKQINELILRYIKFIEITQKKYHNDIHLIKNIFKDDIELPQIFIEINENEKKIILL